MPDVTFRIFFHIHILYVLPRFYQVLGFADNIFQFLNFLRVVQSKKKKKEKKRRFWYITIAYFDMLLVMTNEVSYGNKTTFGTGWSIQWKLMHHTICVCRCILLTRLKIVFFLSPEIFLKIDTYC